MSFFGGLVAAAVSVVSAVVHTVGSAIVAGTTALLAKLPGEVIKAKIIMDAIATIVSKVAEFFGLAPADEDVEILGAKAMQNDVRPQMEGETTKEYLDYLRKEVTLDEEKYAKMSDVEKLACSALGTTMITKSIEEKTGVELPPEFLFTISKAKLRYEQVTKFIEAFRDNGIISMGDFTKYISNNLPEVQAQKVGNVIKGTLKEMNVEMSDADIQKQVIDMKREYNSVN